jgi:ribonuclease G
MALLTPLSQQVGGIVARTAALEADVAAIEAEVAHLAQRWQSLTAQAAQSSRPRVLWTEPTAALRAVRELYRPDMQGVVVNDAALVDALAQEVAAIAPQQQHTVRLWSEAPKGMAGLVEGNLWRSHKVHRARAKALGRQVPLNGGGFLVIEATEALTVIDVNSGTFVGQGTLEKTMVALNVAAARASAAQLRLRNIGGIVVIDFVDLSTAGGKEAVMAALKEAMGTDRAKHHILPMNKLGLVALTRRRLRASLRQSATEPCPYCRGEGAVLTAQEVSEAVLATLYAALAKGSGGALLVNAHPDVARALEGPAAEAVKTLELRMATQVLVVARPTLHRARFEVLSLDEPGAVEAVDLRL